MFIPEKNIYLLEIPKCGSRILVKAADLTYKNNTYRGHKDRNTGLVHLDKLGLINRDTVVVAVIRNPIDRFLSGLNYLCNRDPRYTLDKALVDLTVTGHRQQMVFRTQSSFLTPHDFKGITTRLCHFSQLQEVCRLLGYTGEPLHENKSPKKYTLLDIRHYIDHLNEHYQDDILLNAPFKHLED